MSEYSSSQRDEILRTDLEWYKRRREHEKYVNETDNLIAKWSRRRVSGDYSPTFVKLNLDSAVARHTDAHLALAITMVKLSTDYMKYKDVIIDEALAEDAIRSATSIAGKPTWHPKPGREW